MRVVLKYAAIALLLLHLGLSAVTSEPTIAVDLILYNAIALMIAATALFAPSHNGLTEITLVTIALLLWAISSTISSAQEFFGFSTFIPQVGYTLFYPFALLAIPRIALAQIKLSPVDILDSAIVGLGITALLAAIALVRVLPGTFDSTTYFALFNSVGDLLLVALTISTTSTWGKRALCLLSGVLIYCLTDLLYFWQVLHNTYSFADISDDGWLFGLALIALSLWYPPSQGEPHELLNPTFVGVSVVGSAALLGYIALRPDALPTFTLVPALATLFMAFVRMTIALRHARALSDEKVLARTDELTGLANRRRLIAELPSMQEGALLLMDLDGFKPINDSYGHEVGDKVLRSVAQRFQRVVPEGALLARLGGDEFGALIPGDLNSAFEIALALRATLSYPIAVDGREIALDVSIGCVAADGSDSLLKRADAAMYEAKRAKVGVLTSESLL